MSDFRLEAAIMAAGFGTRMFSPVPKMLSTILGDPLVRYPFEALSGMASPPRKTYAVMGRDSIVHALPESVVWAHQKQMDGTLGAVEAVLSTSEWQSGRATHLLVVNGDAPLLSGELLDDFVRQSVSSGMSMTIATSTLDDPGRYGRVIRDHSGVSMVKEYVDLSPEERTIPEINAGIYLFSREVLEIFLPKVLPHPEKKERFLTTVVELVRLGGGSVGGVVMSPDVVLGVNTQEELSYAAALLRGRINRKHMERGVTFWDPSSTYVGPRVKIAPGTTLFPGVILEGDVVLSERIHVGAGSHLTDVYVGPDATIRDYCVISKSRIEKGAVIGPFAHIRPDSHVGASAHVGNFVELKKTSLGEGAKANHLAYLGDAEVGAGSNIGAGTITCNYDGVSKHKTVLGKNVFVGSDTQFVAPVKVGDGAVIAAGSTITRDVPVDSLSLSRTSQENRDGAAVRYRERLLAEKSRLFSRQAGD